MRQERHGNVGEISNLAREDGPRWRDGAEQRTPVPRESVRSLAALPRASQALSVYLCEMVLRQPPDCLTQHGKLWLSHRFIPNSAQGAIGEFHGAGVAEVAAGTIGGDEHRFAP